MCAWRRSFNSTVFLWLSSLGSHYQTSIRVYDTAVVFSQVYIDGANDTSAEGGDVLSSFPSFAAGNTPQPFGFLAYSGPMVGWYPVYGVWGKDAPSTGLTGSGPIVLFSSDLTTSFVLSAASNFMAASQVRALLLLLLC